mmetsp:Transcript_40194/g.116072  ORF Transcript_40194/g.116072 Transcript_40194/m.116072 type:complete len:257 (+) Transcript_40194:92-862(+)
MAAVVSLAAFVAGCGLPALPLPRGPSQERNLSGEEDLSGGVAWCPAHSQAKLRTPPAAEAQRTLSAAAPPALVKARSEAPGAEARSLGATAAPALAKSRGESAGAEDASVETAEGLAAVLKERPGVLLKAPRPARPRSGPCRVSFDLGKCTVHEVTPYAEVYGVHPRDFNFARGRRAPAACIADTRCASDDWSDSDEEDDEGVGGAWRAKALRLLKVEAVPWPVWSVALVCGFLVRALGREALLELAAGALLAEKA